LNLGEENFQLMKSYKSEKVFITFFVVIFISIIGYLTLMKNPTPTPPTGNNLSPSMEGKILEVTLEVNAPFSTAKLTIFKDGSALYLENQNGQSEKRIIYEEVNVVTSVRQMGRFAELVKESNFFSLKDRPKRPTDPENGSTYTITIKLLPSDSSELVDAVVHTVNCYQFNCEQKFLNIQNEIRAYLKSYWGKEILEVGV